MIYQKLLKVMLDNRLGSFCSKKVSPWIEFRRLTQQLNFSAFIERIDSREPMEMLGVSLFVNLKVLIISPHNLGEDLVECLGNFLFSYTNSLLNATFSKN